MADELSEPIESGGRGGRRKNLIMVGILVGVMLVEGLAVFILAKKFGGQPATAEAGTVDGLDPNEGQLPPEEVEVEVARFRAQNEQARQVAVYDLTVFVTVVKDKEEAFKALVERKRQTIQDRFSSVVRSADPVVLNEPDPAALRQQLQKELSAIVEDPEMIRSVLIPSIVSYREN